MNITLIGMAGSGKTSIGKELAKNLNYGFLDTDKVIENKTGLKAQQIIDRLGDEGFIKIEEKTILGLDKLDNHVMAPGGSVIYSVKAMEFLKKYSVIIFLNTSLKTIQKRLVNQNRRGIVGLADNNLESVFNERLPLYKKYADITIEIPSKFNMDSIVKQISENLN